MKWEEGIWGGKEERMAGWKGKKGSCGRRARAPNESRDRLLVLNVHGKGGTERETERQERDGERGGRRGDADPGGKTGSGEGGEE